jgi:hypothetical protein
MTLDEFANMTRKVIWENGFDDYLPTACYPARHHLMTLTGLSVDVAPEKPVLEWAAKSAAVNEEFLVAFKVDQTHFKIIRHIGPYSEDEVFSIG